MCVVDVGAVVVVVVVGSCIGGCGLVGERVAASPMFVVVLFRLSREKDEVIRV